MTVPVAAAVAARPPGRPWPGSADLSGPRTGSGSPGRVRVQDGREPEARSKIQNGQHKKTVAVTDSKVTASGTVTAVASADRAVTGRNHLSDSQVTVRAARREPGTRLARAWPGTGLGSGRWQLAGKFCGVRRRRTDSPTRTRTVAVTVSSSLRLRSLFRRAFKFQWTDRM